MNNRPTPTELNSIEDLARLVAAGETDWSQYGDVKTVVHDDLILFDYTDKATFANRWNWFERVSRGLVLNRFTGEVVARPFGKFFNYGEGGRLPTGHIVEVSEKLDGSLGILYRHQGRYHICTRGSFTSDQAVWATTWLNAHYKLDGLPDHLTLLFEIVYPENRVVVNYGERAELVLIGARNRFTDYDFPFFPVVSGLANRYGFATPDTFPTTHVENLLAAAKSLDANHEGWVIRFSDDSRWKIKGDRYQEIHRLISQASYRRVLEAVQGGSYEQWIASIPDEFLADVRRWRDDIHRRIETVLLRINAAFDDAPKSSRKEFALWVNAHHPKLAPYLFARLDNKDPLPLIYKIEFQND